MDFGLFWKFHYLLNGARKPLKMVWGVLSQLLETLLLIPHSPMFGPTVMIMMMIMMIVMMIMMMIVMILVMKYGFHYVHTVFYFCPKFCGIS